MMKKTHILLGLVILIFGFSAATAQEKMENKKEKKAAPAAADGADPADVATIDAIMAAVYDVISGDAGVKRDWKRFHSLFHPDARLIPTGRNPETGRYGALVITPDGYIERSGPLLEKNGFHEREIARKTDVYGNIAQVFSTYAAYRRADDKEPFMRGINSFQLLYDGNRWWVLTIFWQAESKDNPVPNKYLKTTK